MPKHVTITNYNNGSQLLIPTSDWTDSGIYTITVKNIVGQESFNSEIKVTGNYKSHSKLWDALIIAQSHYNKINEKGTSWSQIIYYVISVNTVGFLFI